MFQFGPSELFALPLWHSDGLFGKHAGHYDKDSLSPIHTFPEVKIYRLFRHRNGYKI